jgi:hypothetical protein
VKIELPTTLNAAAEIEVGPWDDPDRKGSAYVELYWGRTVIQRWSGLDYETFFGGNDEQRDEALEEFIAAHLKTILHPDQKDHDAAQN